MGDKIQCFVVRKAHHRTNKPLEMTRVLTNKNKQKRMMAKANLSTKGSETAVTHELVT